MIINGREIDEKLRCRDCAGTGKIARKRTGDNVHHLYTCNKCKGRGQIKSYKEIMEGCGNKVDNGGDCFYISLKGTLRLCSTCKRQLKLYRERMGGE